MNEIIEEWRPVIGYEGLYEVSNLGKIKSLNYNHTKQEKILRQVKMKNGYLYVNLYKNAKMKLCRIHKLVANAFLENPNNYTCVNHKDEDKTNNCVDNLEWCDHKYNVNFGTGIKRRVTNTDYKARTNKIDYKAISEKQINDPNKSKKVYQYDKQGNLIKIWESANECKRNGFNQGHVSACCRNESKSHKGFKWSYTPINPK